MPTAVAFSATENSTVPEVSRVRPDVSNTGGSFTSVTATVTVAWSARRGSLFARTVSVKALAGSVKLSKSSPLPK